MQGVRNGDGPVWRADHPVARSRRLVPSRSVSYDGVAALDPVDTHPSVQPQRADRLVSLVGAVLVAAIFVLDLRFPLGLNIPALYLAPLVLSLRQTRWRDTFLLAAGCSALTLLALPFKPAGGNWTAGVTNRVLVILGLWMTAAVIARFKQTLAEQHRASARIRAMLETAVDAVVAIDAHGIIQLVNPAIERLFGYTPSEVLGQNVSMLMPSPDRERHDGYIERYLATGERRIIGIGREVLARRKDGTTFPVYLSVSETVVDGEHTFTGIIYDLTERKRLEAELRERAELARLGQMASVVAHEVRNPLAGIRGALQVIAGRMQGGSREQAVLRDVIDRLDALNAFVDDLLVFSRPKAPVFQRLPLAPLLQRIVELLQRDPECAGVTFEIHGSDVSAEIDEPQIERALLNVLTNAAQAMEGAGRVRIALESTDGVCRISVADTGPGIAPAALEHIFQPFFTTRHRGTGLGLPIAKRAIEQHGGSIAIDSAPGRGTTVVVTLPIAHAEAPAPAPRGEVEPV